MTRALTLELLILVGFAAGWDITGDAVVAVPPAALIVLSALAMGVQSAAIRRLEVSGMAATYISGTLTNLMARLMRPRTISNPPSQHHVLLAAVWIVYFGGAAAAAGALNLNWVFALILPAAVIMCVVIASEVAFRPR